MPAAAAALGTAASLLLTAGLASVSTELAYLTLATRLSPSALVDAHAGHAHY